MVMAVRYRKEVTDSCHSDDKVDEEVSSQEDCSMDETVEMVAIAADSDKNILLPLQLKDQNKVFYK